MSSIGSEVRLTCNPKKLDNSSIHGSNTVGILPLTTDDDTTKRSDNTYKREPCYGYNEQS